MIVLGVRVGTGSGASARIAMPDWPTGLMCAGACIRRFTSEKPLDEITATLVESCERGDLSLVPTRKQFVYATADLLVTLVEMQLVKGS